MTFYCVLPVPLGCIIRSATFNDRVVFQAAAPIAVIALLCCYPLSRSLCGKASLEVKEATTTVKRCALLLLELTLPKITTSLIQVFQCSEFEDGFYLREQLSLRCNGSAQRNAMKVFASFALVCYPFGIPLLICTLLHKYRDAIQKLGTELNLHQQRQGMGLNMQKLSKSRHARGSFVGIATDLRWLRPKFEKYKPASCYAGVRFLGIRLLQTSFMALIPSQHVQAAVMCLLTLAAISLQRETQPYLRPSDNKVVLLVQWLIFGWVSCGCSGLLA